MIELSSGLSRSKFSRYKAAAAALPLLVTLDPETAMNMLSASESPRCTLPLMVPALMKELPIPGELNPCKPMRPVMLPADQQAADRSRP